MPEIIGYIFGRKYYADVVNRRVLLHNEPLDLTGKHFDILEFFLKRPNQVISRKAEIPTLHWNRDDPRQRSPLDNYVSEIEKKLKSKKGFFKSERGVGYRFNVDVQPIYQTDLSRADILIKTSLLQFNEHTTVTMRSAVDNSLKVLDLPHAAQKAYPYIVLAYGLINLGHVAFCKELPERALPEAREFATRALKINPDCAEALGVLGLIALIYGYDWPEAERQLKNALQLAPQEAATLLSYAHLLVSRGDFKKGLEQATLAVAVDPTDKIVHASLGWLHLLAGQRERAAELSEETADLMPEFPPAHHLRGLALEACGDYERARESFIRASELDVLPVSIAALGHLEGTLGNKSAARATLSTLAELQKTGRTAYKSSYCEALVYAGLNQKEKALDALERSYSEHCDWLIHLGVDPRWNGIRRDDRFKLLMAKVGLRTGRSF